MCSRTNSARGIAHWRTAHRADIEIVEHDDVDAPVEWLAIRSRVGRNRPALDDDLVRLLDGNFHERERIDFLRLAVFENREVVARQARHELALLVSDDDVDVDVVDLDLERDAGCLLRLPQRTGDCRTTAATRRGSAEYRMSGGNSYLTSLYLRIEPRRSSRGDHSPFDPSIWPFIR